MGIGDGLRFAMGHEIKHNTIYRRETPVLDTAAAYTAGDSLMTSPLRFANCGRLIGGGGIIKEVVISDKSKSNPELALWIYNQDPGDLTANSSFNPANSTLTDIVGTVFVCQNDYVESDNHSVATIYNIMKEYFTDPASRDLWVHIQVLKTLTSAFSAADDLVLTMIMRQD
jgi:hypothetical protein